MSPAILPQLFNSYVELHSAQMGALIGLLAGFLYRDQRVVAYGLLFVGVLSALGNAPEIGYAGSIGAKPWYFLSALYLTTVFNFALVRYWGVLSDYLFVSRRRPKQPQSD